MSSPPPGRNLPQTSTINFLAITTDEANELSPSGGDTDEDYVSSVTDTGDEDESGDKQEGHDVDPTRFGEEDVKRVVAEATKHAAKEVLTRSLVST